MNQRTCGRHHHATALVTLVAIASATSLVDRTKLLKSTDPQAPQGEGEVAVGRIVLVFVGGSDLVANLLSATDFRTSQLFGITEPNTVTNDGKDEIPVGTFFGNDDIEAAVRQFFKTEGPVFMSFDQVLAQLQAVTDDPLAGFDQKLLAVLRAEGVLIMDAVDGDGAVLDANDVLVDDLVLKNGNNVLTAKNIGDMAWANFRANMVGGKMNQLAGYNDATLGGLGVIDDDTGAPSVGPLAATHGHLDVREDQAALA